MEVPGWGDIEAAWRNTPAIAREEILSALVESDLLLEREVKDRMPTATGVSRDSVFSREENFDSGAIGVVASALPHIAYVELGTRPHFPPVQALEDWVRVKLDVPESQVHSVAYLIARKIAQRGTLGVGMFHGAWAANQQQVAEFFQKARDRIAARLGGAH